MLNNLPAAAWTRLWQNTACVLAFMLGLLALIAGSFAAHAADREPCAAEQGCELAHGRYFAYVPQGQARRALLFFHGFGSSARHELDMPAFRQWAERERTVLLIPDGTDARWSVIDGFAGPRDENAFVAAVLADARTRLRLGDLPVFASGFSLGASMVWKLACAGQPRLAGYVAFSGAFWEPAPAQCAAPAAPLIHFHGTDDTVVPLLGRQVRSGRRQAPVDLAFAAMARAPGCEALAQDRSLARSPSALQCVERIRCGAGAIAFCQHTMGHNFELDWLSFALAEIQRR